MEIENGNLDGIIGFLRIQVVRSLVWVNTTDLCGTQVDGSNQKNIILEPMPLFKAPIFLNYTVIIIIIF